MSKISPDTLKSRPWHGGQLGESSSAKSGWSALEIVVPVVVILLLVAFKALVMAVVVGAISVTVILVRHFSPAGRRMIDRALGVFAHWVGTIVGTVTDPSGAAVPGPGDRALSVMKPTWYIASSTWFRRAVSAAEGLRERAG